jgi:hypothetical protein
MSTYTPFLGMSDFNSTTDGSATFATFRAAIAGVSPTANFNLLDTFAQNISASIISLQGRAIYLVPAVYVSPNYYEANSLTTIKSYTTGMYLDLYLDTTNVDSVTLNINSLGTKTLKKIDATGALIDLTSGDLEKNKEYLFRYNGTYFVWVASSGASGTTYSGSALINITGSKISHETSAVVAGDYLAANLTVDQYGHLTAVSNGTSASSTGAPADSPFLTTGSASGLTNYKQIVGGSCIVLTESGSTLIVASNCIPLVAIAGSSVMSDTTGSQVKHNYSGVIAGSANKVEFDSFGHIKSASVVPIPQTATMTAGQALQTYDASTGAFTKVAIPLTSASVASKALGGYDASTGSFVMVDVSSGSTSSSSGTGYNYLINGGFDIAQRQTPETFTTILTDKYSADRWRISSGSSGGYQYARISGSAEAGLTSQYYGQYKCISGSKVMVYQIIEGINSIPLRGKTVIFQAQMKASSASTIKMGIISYSGSSIDVIPSTFVTAWGAGTSDPTLATNCAIVTGYASKSVTTSFSTHSVSVTVPTNCQNLICAILPESTLSSGNTLSIAESGLYISSTTQTWSPRSFGAEQALCERYCEVISSAEDGGAATYGVAQCASTTRALNSLRFRTLKFRRPDITLSAIGDWAFYDSAINAFKPWTSVSISKTSAGCHFDATCSGGGLAGAGYATLMAPNGATTAAKIFIDAEL